MYETLLHRHTQRCRLIALVVMDDHVHVLFGTHPGISLDRLQHSWKSYSAHRLQREHRRHGRIWQEEAWDRIVRNETELWRESRYIQSNPQRRWPWIVEYPWVWMDPG